MTVESVTYINDLEPANPKGGDSIAQGDNHIRNTKLALRNTFPNIDGEVSATDEEMNYLVGLTGPIKDEIESGANDIAQLAVDVAKNTADIATNASGIATNASDIAANASDIAANASDIATNASGIATNASGIASNDAELADHESRISANTQGIASIEQNKADKSYVDSQNAAQDAVISNKADRAYVDSQNNAQDSVISKKADKTYVDSQNAAQDSAISQKADKTYVDAQDSALAGRISSLENVDHSHTIGSHTDVDLTGIQEGCALVWDGTKWIAKKIGGGMLTLVDQPATVGVFSLKSGAYGQPGVDDVYYSTPVSGTQLVTFTVPAGKVFVMDYIFCFGYTDIDLNSIKVDGLTMMPGVSGVMSFDNPADPDFNFSAWPTPYSGSSIRVEQSVQFRYRDRMVGGDAPEACISGLFIEA